MFVLLVLFAAGSLGLQSPIIQDTLASDGIIDVTAGLEVADGDTTWLDTALLHRAGFLQRRLRTTHLQSQGSA